MKKESASVWIRQQSALHEKKISQFHTHRSLPTTKDCFCIVRCFLPPFIFFLPFWGCSFSAVKSWLKGCRLVNVRPRSGQIYDTIYTPSLYTRKTAQKAKNPLLRGACSQKKLGQCFFLWEETEGNRFIAEGPSFYETKNLWFFSHLSWLHFAAELKGKLHFYWREDVMKFEIKPSLKKIQTTCQRDGMFMSSDQGLKARKSKNLAWKVHCLGKKWWVSGFREWETSWSYTCLWWGWNEMKPSLIPCCSRVPPPKSRSFALCRGPQGEILGKQIRLLRGWQNVRGSLLGWSKLRKWAPSPVMSRVKKLHL